MPNIDLLNSQVNGSQAKFNQVSETLHTSQSPKPDLDLEVVNQTLTNANAQQVVEWATQTFDEGLVMSTSFGIQAAVMLHLVTQVVPHI
ncbi:MAG TPA: phosphoadenosine phosphosulfate reductase, partial [Cyanothece sp. UBA12306]|nr:phosphoadenosine phosphosulfate reductase [Cyanothece sp. UBA12306]